MTTPSLAELRAAWAAGPDSGPWRGLINLLVDGRPVTAEALAAATRRSVGQVRADIANARRRGVQVDDGAVVGAAPTLRPTPHRFRVRGHDLYARCGFDALFLPIVLGERAEVASTCPVTREAIHLTVEADGTVSGAEPRDAGLRWRVDHPSVAIVDLADARDIAHTYIRNVKDT